MDALYAQIKLRHENTTMYQAKMIGVVETMNKNIKKILQKMLIYRDWHAELPFALLNNRTSTCSSAGATPYSLVYQIRSYLLKWKSLHSES